MNLITGTLQLSYGHIGVLLVEVGVNNTFSSSIYTCLAEVKMGRSASLRGGSTGI